MSEAMDAAAPPAPAAGAAGEQGGVPEPPAAVVEAGRAAAEAASFGALLAAERERQGLTREQIAARLRLAPRQIAALESLRLEDFPQGPFVRGFVRSYAKELGIDSAPLLTDLAQRVAPPPALPEIDLGPSAPARAVGREPWPRRVVIWGAAVALGVFALIGVLVSRAPPAETVPVPVAAKTEAPAAEAPPAEPAKQDAESPPAPPPPDLRIVIGNRASWVEVAQADGAVIASGLQPPATELTLTGRRPLRLVIGNASGVTVESRGEPVALAPHMQSDVARLTLD